jgi:hypothetical protein|nr:MAG TPA: hypothetical protein [Caudoviricetes sp.]
MDMKSKENKQQMTSQLSKEAFIKLAEAYSKQENYEKELSNNLEAVTEKYKVHMGFIGFPGSSELIMDVVLDLLGDDFIYYFYDCDASFDKFNKNILLEGGKHPNVNDFGELWEFSQKYGIGTK